MAREALTDETIRQVYQAIPHLIRLPSTKVWVDYDREADVLYLSLKRPQRATDTQSVENEGLLLRYRGDELVGITILDASKRQAVGKRA